MNHKNNTKKGFSLIELIVVIAIILIMTLLLFATSFDDAKKNDLQVGAREVAVSLRQAQNAALTGRLVGSHRTCNFTFSGAGSSYEISYEYYDPSTGGTSCSGGDTNTDGVLQSAVALPGTLVFQNSIDLEFRAPHGVISNSAGEITAVQPITLENDGLIFNICVHPSGRIDEVGSATCS